MQTSDLHYRVVMQGGGGGETASKVQRSCMCLDFSTFVKFMTILNLRIFLEKESRALP